MNAKLKALVVEALHAERVKMGRKGGKAKSPAKTKAARKAIAERWRRYRLAHEKGKP